MIVLSCAKCGHQINVGDSMRDVKVRCARCGNALVPQGDALGTVIQSTPILAPVNDATKGNTLEDETLNPHAPAPMLSSFPFLAPAKDPNEVGWLGHYRVLRLLGQGGMGIVFEAFDTNLHRPIALKVMKPDLAQDDSARQRFLREARALAAVHSDHVVTVHEVGQRNNLPFLAMEFLNGEPMDFWLKRRGKPSPAEILRLGIQIARGLAAAHERGLIHRDIKPGNIFLEGSRPHLPQDDDLATRATAIQTRPPLHDCSVLPTAGPLPETCRVKILDFGLARVVGDHSNLTNPGMVAGTPAYMAPEQVEGRKAVDARCDLFSLGCILYELATGEQAFSGSSTLAILMAVATKDPRSPRDANRDIPPALAKLILRLLAKDPRDRPASAHDVAAALETITVTDGAERIEWGKRWWVALGIALAAAIGAGAIWWGRGL